MSDVRGNFVESVFLLAPGATVQRTAEMGKNVVSTTLNVSEKHRKLYLTSYYA